MEDDSSEAFLDATTSELEKNVLFLKKTKSLIL